MDTVHKNKYSQIFLSIGLIVFLACLFYGQALFEGKSQIHRDSILTGLPLMDFHAKALHGINPLLWTNLIYGGHPIFAEAQGAFVHPLVILLDLFVPPVYGQNLFHWICIIISSTGTFALCRYLSLGNLPSLFGAISLGFLPLWLGVQTNLTLSGSLS
jgi:hypothetical protein